MADKLIVHLGMQKCMSTSLQTGLFKLCGYRYLSNYPNFEDDFYSRFVEKSHFDFSDADIKWLEKILSDVDGTAIISEENLCGWIYSPINFSILMERISKISIKVGVILIVREQRALINSLYSNLIKNGVCLKKTDFLNSEISPYNSGIIEKCRYGSLAKCLQEMFGVEETNVLFLEEIRDDISPLAELVGLESFNEEERSSVNTGLPNWMFPLVACVNLLGMNRSGKLGSRLARAGALVSPTSRVSLEKYISADHLKIIANENALLKSLIGRVPAGYILDE